MPAPETADRVDTPPRRTGVHVGDTLRAYDTGPAHVETIDTVAEDALVVDGG